MNELGDGKGENAKERGVINGEKQVGNKSSAEGKLKQTVFVMLLNDVDNTETDTE